MRKIIEVNNEGSKPFFAMACETKIGHTTYIHISENKDDFHSGVVKRVEPGNYAQLPINDVDY